MDDLIVGIGYIDSDGHILIVCQATESEGG